jgi:hypothetical protein
MKYFTREWWEAGSADAGAVFERYEAYLASVRDRLPPALVVLEAEHTLHDSEVKRVVCSFADERLSMVLAGWNRELEHRVRYELQFSEVVLFEQVFPQQAYVEEELGDLGYWECERLGNLVEVRMLFVSNAQFRIQFTGFNFKHSRDEA